MMHDFIVSEVFDVQRCRNLKSELCVPGNMHYVTRTAVNNGVQGLCGNTDFANKGNCIIIGGESAVAFYQNEPFVTGNNITVLRNENMTEPSGLYIVAVLNKFTPLYSYSKAWNTKRVRDTIISLPVTESSDPHHVYTPDDIDWAYMEDHIRRLEEDHIRRLEEYLKVAGFESTILTSEEQEVLRKFRTRGVIFRKYRICDLFDVKTTHSFNKNSINIYSKGDIDFIGRSSVNNGIQGKCKRESVNPNPANTFSVVQVGESVCLFREREWYASQNIFIMYPKNSDLSRNHLFIQAAVNKILGQMYKSAYVYPKLNDIKNLEISLPCLPSGAPDYALMETCIRALEKQSISRLDTMQKEEEKLTKKITKER